MSDAPERVLTLTAQIVSAYLQSSRLSASQLPGVIRNVRRSLSDVAGDTPAAQATDLGSNKPAIGKKRAVFPDHLVCLEDGLEMKALKRHLRSAHGMTPDEYRAKWELPADYPMIAPQYAELRSTLARRSGLGKRR
jgi:predicted transcriptional regulator